MNRKFFTLIVLFITILPLQAQYNLLTFGLKVSPSVSWVDVSNNNATADGASVKMGVGALVNVRLNDSFFAVSGVNYQGMGGYMYDKEPASVNNYRVNYMAVDIPIALKYRSAPIQDFSYYFQGGFSFGVITSANQKDKGADAVNIKPYTTPTYIGASIGAGVEYPVFRRSSIFGQITFNRVLTNIAKSNYTNLERYDEKLRINPSSLEFSIGIIY